MTEINVYMYMHIWVVVILMHTFEKNLTVHLNSEQFIESQLCPYLTEYLLEKKSLYCVEYESEGSKTGVRKEL